VVSVRASPPPSYLRVLYPGSAKFRHPGPPAGVGGPRTPGGVRSRLGAGGPRHRGRRCSSMAPLSAGGAPPRGRGATGRSPSLRPAAVRAASPNPDRGSGVGGGKTLCCSTYIDFVENQLSPGPLSFSLQPTTHPMLLQQQRVRPDTGFSQRGRPRRLSPGASNPGPDPSWGPTAGPSPPSSPGHG